MAGIIAFDAISSVTSSTLGSSTLRPIISSAGISLLLASHELTPGVLVNTFSIRPRDPEKAAGTAALIAASIAPDFKRSPGFPESVPYSPPKLVLVSKAFPSGPTFASVAAAAGQVAPKVGAPAATSPMPEPILPIICPPYPNPGLSSLNASCRLRCSASAAAYRSL